MTDTSPYSLIYGILLAVQILIAIVIGGLILIQRSEGGALGIGGGGGGGGFMSARGAGNFLTKATGFLAALLFINSIALFSIGNLANRETSAVDSVGVENIQPILPSDAPAAPSEQPQNQPATPSAPGLGDLPLAPAAQGASSPAGQ